MPEHLSKSAFARLKAQMDRIELLLKEVLREREPMLPVRSSVKDSILPTATYRRLAREQRKT